ncbi:MAG: glycosyltransferase, partial [Trueperaceae bacterium]
MISVIVPTHNRKALLEKKLKALEQQTPLETIVVADGCTDDTLEFLRAYKPNYTLHILETPGKGAAF